MKTKINQIKKILTDLPWVIARHAFLVCLFLFFLVLVLGGFFFYKYSILAQKAEIKFPEKDFLLNEKTYQAVLEVWQENEKKSQESETKECLNPFEARVD